MRIEGQSANAAALPMAKRMLTSRFLREAVVILLAYIPYFLARAHAVENAQAAFAHADQLVSFETSVGIFEEVSLQSAIISYSLLVHIFNGIYFYGHWPVIIAAGAYLFIKHPRVYDITRNAFLISGACALVLYALFPVAPPRLIGGFVDTLGMTVPVSLDQSRLVNPFAALPSLHVGWNLLIALGLFLATRHPLLRTFALLLPPTMLLATVVTGNHFFIDGIAGGTLALVAFLLAHWLHRSWPAIEARCLAALRRLRPSSQPSPT